MSGTTSLNFEHLVKGKSIAVVGNSLSLFDKNHGNIIDSHDIVIRFNKAAPTQDAECKKTHGEKFDVWAFWAIGAFYKRVIEEENDEKISSMFHNQNNILKIQIAKSRNRIDISNTHAFDTLSHNHIKDLKRQLLYSKTYIGRPGISSQRNLLEKANVKPLSYEPSAGVGVLYWLTPCQPAKVSIFGMDFKRTPTFSEVSKYDKDMIGQVDIRCKHNFLLEESFVKNIILRDKRFELK